MGASQGKPVAKLTREEVAQAVEAIGKGYQIYKAMILRNGVDGSLLDSLSDVEMEETLDDLGITNPLHRRVLVKTLQIAKLHDDYLSPDYDYSPETPSMSLEAYERVTTTCLHSNKETAVMAGVHLILQNGNHLSLDTKMLQDGRMATQRLHVPAQKSLCNKLVNDKSRCEYYKMSMPAELSETLFRTTSSPFTYTGHVLKNESGKRIGMVCMVDQGKPSSVKDQERQVFLRQMAAAVEYQLKLRKTLLARKAKLLLEQQEGGGGGGDGVDIGECSIDELTASAAVSATTPIQTSADSEKEIDRQNHELVEKRPSPSVANTALPPSHSSSSQLSIPPLPTKFHMTHSSSLEAMGLTDIEPDDLIAIHLKNMVEMAMQAFNFPYGEIIFQNNDSYFRIATISGSHELNNALTHMNQVVKRNSDGTPFLCKMLRASVIYKNSLEAVKTCVVQDMAKTDNFPWLAAVSPIRSYVGSPIMDAAGKRKAVLCLCDTKPRPDIDMAQEFQIEQFAKLVMQIMENWALTRAIEDLEQGRNHIHDKTGPPRKRDVTIVVTSIEGVEALRKSIPSIMEDSQNVHNDTIRSICLKYWGYEFETEASSSSSSTSSEASGEKGELAFAFHDPVDAIGFAVEAQSALYEVDWPEGLEHQPEAAHVEGSFRGLRVKMGIHHGRVEVVDHGVSGRVRYLGQTVSLAKSLCDTALGGQILTTFKTWDVASYFTGSNIGCPQVLDLGMHVIQMEDKSYSRDGVETTRIVQLVPPNLAYDYFAARKLPSKDDATHSTEVVATPKSQSLTGRQFRLIATVKQVSASFHDAPFKNNKVTIAFVNMSAIDDRHVSFLINLIGFLLDCEKEFGGYQCKKEMLVFRRPVDAVLFGLRLQEEIRLREPQADESTCLANLIKFGCMHDYFVTMGPQRTTGRADYFGKAVNRAARLSSAALPGTICFGVVSESGSTSNDPATGRFDRIEHPSIKTRFARKERFKGIRDEFDVYECERVGYM